MISHTLFRVAQRKFYALFQAKTLIRFFWISRRRLWSVHFTVQQNASNTSLLMEFRKKKKTKIFLFLFYFIYLYFYIFINDRHCVHFAAAGGNLEIFNSFNYGDQICDFIDRDGNTPLHYAAKFGRVAIVKAICVTGCTVTQHNRSGWTAGHYAASIGNVPILAALHENGDELNTRNPSAVPFLIYFLIFIGLRLIMR
jgi:hypothetical protein